MPAPYVKVLRHYVHLPILLISVCEAVMAVAAAYGGYLTRFGALPDFYDFLPTALTFGFAVWAAMTAMGVYESRIREGMLGMSLRSAVAIFLLATLGTAIVFALTPFEGMNGGVLLYAALESFLLLALFRWLVYSAVDESMFKRRVVVLGIGRRALKIAARMRRRYDQRAFTLLGFLAPDNELVNDQVSDVGARVIRTDLTLPDYCREYLVHEVVVAMDERRRNQEASGGLPLDELIECRLGGVNVSDVQQFIEREASKVDIDLLRPSWLVFSDGFVMNARRAFVKRSFDLIASVLLLLLAWPVILLTALLVKLEQPDQPVLYRQRRVGLEEKLFDLFKFRSMRAGGEDAPAWTQQNDPRITRIGAFIRNTRIDELPQLFNVLRGDMSFVGPRPERAVLVDELKDKIPFYDQRHRVKPGITGWAQLCYPYGASVEDAKEKLQYDLYYLKNHSLLLDLIILLQTVEVVLVGEGAR